MDKGLQQCWKDNGFKKTVVLLSLTQLLIFGPKSLPENQRVIKVSL